MQNIQMERRQRGYRPPATGFQWAGARLEQALNRATIRSPLLRRLLAMAFLPIVWRLGLRINYSDDDFYVETPHSRMNRNAYGTVGGAAPPRSYFGVFAGRNPDNPNALAFLDLETCNPADLFDADDATLDHAVSGTPKLIRTIAANQVPNLFSVEDPSPKWSAAASAVAARPDFRSRIGAALARRFLDREEPEHVEERIYSGFYCSEDKRLLRDFHASGWERRAAIIDSLTDERLKQLGRRVIYSNSPNLLPESYLRRAAGQIRARWLANDRDSPWTTQAMIDEQLAEIVKSELMPSAAVSSLRDFYGFKLRSTTPP
jgi:exodeoxyribonuclease-1